MNKKIITILPYALVALIVVYQLVTYDKINRGIVETEEGESIPSNPPVLSFLASFDGTDNIEFPMDSTLKYEGKGSAKIVASHLFGPTFSSTDTVTLKKAKRVTASFMAYSDVVVISPQIVVSIANDKGVLVYQALQLPQQLKMKEWTKMEITFPINDALLSKESKLELKVYVMNPKNEVFSMDNFRADLWDYK